MPHLVDCSDEEWKAVLPEVARSNTAAQKAGLKMAPLKAYSKSLRRRVDQGIIPGFCSLVLWRGALLHVDAYGYADLERKTPMRTDSIVRLYCMGKSVVAAALMALVERGRCSLEDDVSKYIPAFGQTRVASKSENETASPDDQPPKKPLTLRRILTHCSGLGYGKELNLPPEGPAERSYDGLVQGVEDGSIGTISSFCDALAALPLRHEPGLKFDYSHGIDVIGRVIEVASGQPLDIFLKEAIFEPLGMVDTGFSVPAEKMQRLSGVYGAFGTACGLGAAEGKPPAEEWSLIRLDGAAPEESVWAEGNHCAVLSGGGLLGHNQGGLVSTLNDQARFFLAISRGGSLPDGSRILREETVRDMVARDWLRATECIGHPCANDATSGIAAPGAFGWNCLGELGVVPPERNDCFEEGEYGYAGIAETFWSINPKREMLILWFTQQVDNFSWDKDEANLWLAARRAVEAVRPERPALPVSKRLRVKTKSAPKDANGPS